MTILLRTLTHKSTIGFGNCKDLTVQNMLDQGRHGELKKYYFRLSMISFNNEVLNELGVTEEHRIAKPGKDVQYLKDNWRAMFVDLNRALIGHVKKQAKAGRVANQVARNLHIHSKGWNKGKQQYK